jgi:RHS repeat-associated protein
MERDDETGLGHHSARYFAQWLGRWTQSDPLGLIDGLNTYSYASNSPVRVVDPSGHDGWDRVLGGVKAVGGVLEIVAGGALIAAGVATSEIGVGIPVAAAGTLVFGHGIDTTGSGINTAIAGEPVDSITSMGLQEAGMSRPAANLTDAGVSIVGSLGAGVVTAGLKVSAVASADPLAKGMSTRNLLTNIESGSRALNTADYVALGKETTSALAKAKMIKEGVDVAGKEYALTTTLAEETLKSIQIIGTGPTPLGNVAVGVLGAGGGTVSAISTMLEASETECPVTSAREDASGTAGSVRLSSQAAESMSWSTEPPMSVDPSLPTAKEIEAQQSLLEPYRY